MFNKEEFKQHGYQIIDWIADYYDSGVEQYPVLSNSLPGDVLSKLPSVPPEKSESFNLIWQDFINIILPGITHWQSPKFFAYFPSNTSYESILGDLLASALGVINFSWETSPAATELEQCVMEWLRKMLGLDEGFYGVIQDTASTATLTAIISAREKISSFSINNEGFSNKKLRLYCSEEAHSSIEKDAKIAGFGLNNVVKISVDSKFAMNSIALEKAIIDDISKGYIPCCIVAAFGTTGSLAIDPINEITQIAKQFNIWLHIDAAFSGTALILDEYANWRKPISEADSIVFNPHKWMFTNFDFSAYFVKDKNHLINTFTAHPEYLKTQFDNEVVNFKDWGIQLGRKFRALKLWFVIRSFGIEGISSLLKKHISFAKLLYEQIINDGRFEILAPLELNLICFRLNNGKYTESELNNINEKYKEALNRTGVIMLTHTKLNGKYTLRIAIGKTYVEEHHIFETFDILQKIANQFV